MSTGDGGGEVGQHPEKDNRKVDLGTVLGLISRCNPDDVQSVRGRMTCVIETDTGDLAVDRQGTEVWWRRPDCRRFESTDQVMVQRGCHNWTYWPRSGRGTYFAMDGPSSGQLDGLIHTRQLLAADLEVIGADRLAGRKVMNIRATAPDAGTGALGSMDFTFAGFGIGRDNAFELVIDAESGRVLRLAIGWGRNRQEICDIVYDENLADELFASPIPPGIEARLAEHENFDDLASLHAAIPGPRLVPTQLPVGATPHSFSVVRHAQDDWQARIDYSVWPGPTRFSIKIGSSDDSYPTGREAVEVVDGITLHLLTAYRYVGVKRLDLAHGVEVAVQGDDARTIATTVAASFAEVEVQAEDET